MRLLWWSCNLPSFWNNEIVSVIWWVWASHSLTRSARQGVHVCKWKWLITNWFTHLQHILIHVIYKTVSSNTIQVQCILSFPICEDSFPHSFPLTTAPPPLNGVGCGGGMSLCRCGDTGNHVDWAPLAGHHCHNRGRVTPLSDQVGGVTHPLIDDQVCYCLLALLPSLPSSDEPPCGSGCICGVSIE